MGTSVHVLLKSGARGGRPPLVPPWLPPSGPGEPGAHSHWSFEKPVLPVPPG